MSSDKTGEKPVRRKPKGSWVKLISPGLVDPKARPKGVADGKQVNIPAPSQMVSTGGTEKGSSSPYWLARKGGVQTRRRLL